MIFVFDLDGTLIDSSKRHYVLMEKLLKEYAPEIEFDAKAFMEYKCLGNSGFKYLTSQLNMSEELARKIMDAWKANIENEEYMEMDELYPDTIRFLDVVKRKGYKMIFLTARNARSTTMKQLEKFGISGYPEMVFIVSPARPTEEKLDVIMTYLETGQEPIIVGDTESEYDTAYSAGINYFIVNRGFRSKKYWEARDVITLDDLQSLADIIDR